MKNTRLIIIATLSMGLVFTSCDQSSNADTSVGSLETAKDSLGYAFGIVTANNFVKENLEINGNSFNTAFNSMLNGEESFMTIEESNEFLKIFFDKKQQDDLAKNLKKGADYLASNAKKAGVKITESGLQYEVLNSGEGASPTADSKVTVHYTGTLIDGTVFDSSVERGEPAKFGVGQVIPGWTEALKMMKIGDKWKIAIPSDLAYGSRGAGQTIGPDETLLFDIELLGIE